jgi:hypothetical protein
MTAPTYRREPRVVWRVAHGAAVVRKVGVRDPDAAFDLVGAAGMVWIALDRPRSVREITDELELADGVVTAALEELVGGGLVREEP